MKNVANASVICNEINGITVISNLRPLYRTAHENFSNLVNISTVFLLSSCLFSTLVFQLLLQAVTLGSQARSSLQED